MILSFSLDFNLLGQCLNDHEKHVFQAGEEVYYQVYYNWSFIWVKAGEVYFKVKKDTLQDKSVLHFDSYGSSLSGWDWFYKVRDSYQAWVDPQTLYPYKFERSTLEGGYAVNNYYQFDYKQQLIYAVTENSKKPKSQDTLSLKPCTFDVLSIIYQARNINYNNYQPNDRIPIRVIIDGEIYDLYIRYLGKEKVKDRDNNEYDCIKFKPLLVEGTIFSGGEDMTVWVTNDQNRVPVIVEAKVLVGSIKAIIDNAYNLKY
ncbi:MAG: DUF3108 domain-containing protein [Candidatus Cyclobacteriaceae bacterium M3_2C_046]